MAGLRAGFYFAAVLWLAAVILARGADAKNSSEKSREDAAKYYQT
ncbi:hypothetical protein AB0X70_04700 [Bacillus velezensis]|nr:MULTISPECIES: hypothetical protein [Bacillus]MCX2915805.1 hypothetical protein [Bacillus velezensis]MCY6274699.1 hypothetical protein [Bacillus sp. NEAU-16]MDA3606454.1 hypothetical protein [Bacillus sp. NEAU-242-2]